MKNDLKKYKLKHTPIREELLKLISESTTAIPFTEIQSQLKSYDRVTIYRSLSTFTKKGIIHKIISDNGSVFYAFCKHECDEKGHTHDHIHFECQNCKNVECIDIDPNLNLNLNGYKISETQVNVRGLCPNCS
jgi:Fur family ferric uptake transcriptional regulator